MNCEDLEKLLEGIFHKGDQVIITGDFNVWIEQNSTDSAKLTRTMNAYGLEQIVDEPTHIAGHTLDHVYVNNCQMKLKCKVGDRCDISTDHFPITFCLPQIVNNTNTETIVFRDERNMDLDALINELEEAYQKIDFEDGRSFETKYSEYRTMSESIIDKLVPNITKTLKPRRKIPWMDEEFRSNRRIRRQLEKKWRRNRCEENRQRYITQRKICAVMSLKKQKFYYSKIVEKAGNDQKTLFNVANRLLDKGKSRTLPEHTDALKLADDFNEYYLEKIGKLRKSIPPSNGENDVENREFKGIELSIYEPTTEEELGELIKEFGIKTSLEDPIPANVLRKVIDVALPCITKLINKSLSDGSMEGVKSSVIDPILKKMGLDSNNKKNYRPVNNLVFFSKLTERVVKKRLIEHMAKNGLHSSSQFGYKKNHSTETMMLGLVNDVLMGFDNSMCTIMIFLDLSAAFDTIDQNKLIEILATEIGVMGVALEWFKSFIFGRTQRVSIGGKFSSILEVLFGTAQGSVLGPDLFNIYVRNLPKVFESCQFKSTSFADDSNGMKTFAIEFQYQVCKNDIATVIREITHWMNTQFLKINPEKTEIILFHLKTLEQQIIIRGTLIEDQCIRYSKAVKNVGVWLDEHLNMDKHVNNVVSHCYKILKDIGRIRNVLSDKHTEMLIHAVISSRLDYCNSLFFNISKSNLYKLQKVQNAAARLIARKRKRDGISATLEKLHWLPIESRVIFKILLLVFKCINGICSDNLVSKLKLKKYNCRSEYYLQLETRKASTKHGRRTFEYAGPRLWNTLPLNIRSEKEAESFKRKVKSLLFTDTEGFKRKAFQYE